MRTDWAGASAPVASSWRWAMVSTGSGPSWCSSALSRPVDCERRGHRAAVLAVDGLDDRHLALARTLAGNDQRAGREPGAQHEDDDQS